MGEEPEQSEPVVDRDEHTASGRQGVARVVDRVAAETVGVVAAVDPHHHRQVAGAGRCADVQREAVLVLVSRHQPERGRERALTRRRQAEAGDQFVDDVVHRRRPLVRHRAGLLARQRLTPGRRWLRRPPAEVTDGWGGVRDTGEQLDRVLPAEPAAHRTRGRLDDRTRLAFQHGRPPRCGSDNCVTPMKPIPIVCHRLDGHGRSRRARPANVTGSYRIRVRYAGGGDDAPSSGHQCLGSSRLPCSCRSASRSASFGDRAASFAHHRFAGLE